MAIQQTFVMKDILTSKSRKSTRETNAGSVPPSVQNSQVSEPLELTHLNRMQFPAITCQHVCSVKRVYRFVRASVD